VQSDATGPFLGRLLAIAEASKREEDDFRKSTAMARLNITEANFGQESQRHLEALTAVRVGAYRRYYLLKGMAEAVRTPATSEGVVPAALDFVLGETGWSPADAGYAEVREQLKDAARAVEAALQAEAQAASGGEAEAGGGDAPIEACYRFEAWYRERFGSEFLERLEAKRAFLSVADF
jgi:hypothetical protein